MLYTALISSHHCSNKANTEKFTVLTVTRITCFYESSIRLPWHSTCQVFHTSRDCPRGQVKMLLRSRRNQRCRKRNENGTKHWVLQSVSKKFENTQWQRLEMKRKTIVPQKIFGAKLTSASPLDGRGWRKQCAFERLQASQACNSPQLDKHDWSTSLSPDNSWLRPRHKPNIQTKRTPRRQAWNWRLWPREWFNSSPWVERRV